MSAPAKPLEELSRQELDELIRRLQEQGPAPPPAAGWRPAGSSPVSFAQRRLWFLDQLDPGSPVYNIAGAIDLAGPLHGGALARALDEIVRRHEALRTFFAAAGGEPVQKVCPPFSLAPPVVDLTALPPMARQEVAERLAAAAARGPFDLSRPPLVRALLLRLAAQEHALLVTLHHTVADGWSLGVFLRDLVALYGAAGAGRPSPLPPLPIQSADLACREREKMQGEPLQRLLAYWRHRLADLPLLPALPTDRPRPAQPGTRGGRVPIVLPAKLSREVEAFARRRGGLPFMALLAALDALLCRYTGQEDLIVGSAAANRDRAETEDLVGFFINTLVLRGDLSGDPTAEQLLDRVRRATLEDWAHQELPFDLLVQDLHHPTDLFRVMLVVQPQALAVIRAAGLTLRPRALDTGTAKFDLTVDLVAGSGGFTGSVEYSADLFDAATVALLAGHLQMLLAGMVEDPERRLSELPLLTNPEREQLRQWHGATLAGVEERCLHELFTAQVARTPDAVAVIAGEARLTYAELNARANRLAHHLRQLGVGPETRVGISLERGPDTVPALLGILKAGGAYVALDPAYPAARRAFIQEDSRAALLLSGPWLDREREAIARCSGDDPAGGAGADNLAYAIYTSGSTGVPKGVGITHRSAATLLRWAAAAFTSEELSGVLASTSLCFDVSVFELFAPLALGGTVILAESVLDLPRLPAAGAVKLISTVPSLMAELVRSGGVPSSVRVLGLGGEPLRRRLVQGIAESLPAARVLNLYGPSEDTTYSTCEVVPLASDDEPAIGRPLPGTRAHVLDRHFQPVPLGITGELHLAGAGLARGYLDRPELTAARFLPDPFAARPGERIYATGDLVRRLPDGRLACLGRRDHQVKVHGVRIELGEIETLLERHPAVREAVVVAREEGSEGHLVAYTVLDGPAAATLEELRGFLGRTLPLPMIPTAFVLLPELPRHPNGKLDRAALPAPGGAVETAPVPALPRGRDEERVALLWTEVLERGDQAIGANDSFFSLGGHSLLATRLLSRVREEFGVELTLRGFFAAPTVAGLAHHLQGARQSLTPPIRPLPWQGDPPLSFAQERLWFLDRLEPGSSTYVIAAAQALRGPLRPAVLAAALNEVVRRHEALRTTFILSEGTADGEPRQRIASHLQVDLPLIDLRALPPTVREPAARRLTDDWGERPFDLTAGPLLRAALLWLGGEQGEEEHTVLLSMHHIVTDGWSLQVLLRELTVLYMAGATGQPSPLPELPVQYADFAAWQRRWLSGEALAGQLSYWRRQLGGAPTLELPSDRPVPRVRSPRGASLPVALSPELVRDLLALAHRGQATLFMALLAGFTTLLSRYTGQEDIVVGSPIANRNRAETEGLIGFFVNTLVLRTNLAGDPDAGELLRRAREIALDAYAHQDLPFEKLVAELAPDRDLSRLPLFRVLLALMDAPATTPTLPGVVVAPLPMANRTAKFDLTLSLVPAGAGLEGWLEYSTELFDAVTVRRLLAHLERLLAGLADPEAGETRLSTLPLLAPAERRQLLGEWNDTGSADDTAPELCLHQLFESQAARTPDAVALVSPDGRRRLSYRELDVQAEAVARRLRALGVAPEVLAGVLMDRTVELVVALLAVLKAGGAYVPIDPAYPRQRVATLLASSGAAVLLTRRSLLEEFGESLPPAAVAIFLDEEEAGSPSEAPAALPPRSGNLAYVIYTSGSTGDPKGVAIEHRSAVAFARWAQRAYTPEERAGVLGSTSVCFDISIMEIFVTLAWGGRILLAENALALPTLPARDEVTMINAVPSAMAELVRSDRLPDAVRVVNTGGEAVKGALARRIYEQSRAARVVDVYGPSEDTTYSTTSEIPRDVENPTVGRPIRGTRAYVLDAELRPVPIGVAGAVYLAGDGLARGYLGRPALTAERFIPDPHGEPGARLYRVGDLARWRADGEIDYLGRIDHQVKVRGFRIEPGEIEAALATHPGVEAVAVGTHEAESGDLRLVAYVIPRPGCEPAVDELRDLVAERLPSYMVPAAFVALAAFPLTPSGKVDRRALPAPDWIRGATATAAAPGNTVEELLVQLWAELLGLEPGRVEVDDDFFTLGGHSLLATRLISRIREDLRVEMPLRSLFEARTPAALARLVLAVREGLQAPPIRPLPRTGPLPLSFAQERLWFLDQLEPGGAAYHIAAAERLRGPLDTPALAAALDEIVRRHEPLRTTFAVESGGPVQRIAAPRRAVLPVLDLGGLAPDVQQREAERLAAEESHRSFDLARGPLLRTALLRLAGEEHWLLLTLHHIVADGWSIGVFVRELSALYAACAAGRPTPLPELPVQYADVAVWQRQRFSGEALAAQLAYWRRQLDGIAVLDLPTDRPAPAVRDTRGATLPFNLPPELRSALEALAHRERSTLFMALLAGFTALLSRHTAQEDVAVGTVIANRNRAETEGLIGFFVNTLVLRTDLAGDPDAGELMLRAREVALDAYAHQDLPFEKLVAELTPDRDLSRPPLFRVLLVLQNASLPAPVLPGVAAEALPVASRTAKFDLTLSLVPAGAGLDGWLEYSTGLFDAVTVQRLLAHLERLLAGLADPEARETRLAILPLLAPAERLQLLVEWNDTATAPAPELCLHQLFEAQAARTPEAVALVSPDGRRRLSYRELDAQADGLARRLRARGLGAEVLAGVLMDRTVELVVALLAVLKAGGAYVPIDPTYPRHRVALLLASSGAAVLLTRRSLLEEFAESLPPAAVPVFLDELDELDEMQETGATHPPRPGNLAYVIYTSGSTGDPKGVAIEHRSAVAFARWAQRAYTPEERAGVLGSTSVCFDISIMEIFVTLAWGGRILLAENVLALPNLPARDEVTMINAVPSAMAELVRGDRLPDSVRVVNVGGEAVKGSLARRVYEQSRAGRVIDVYGPSEDTTYSATSHIPRDVETPAIGRPIQGSRAYVLDAGLRPVPIGVAGAVYLAGDGLARGYLGRPALTAERFIPDPYGDPGARLYRVGDLARWRAGGEMEYLGRIDHQVKVRGFRIEPGEIEAALVGHPAVRQAAVVAREVADEQRLIAYLSLDRPADAAELRADLQRKLPPYMVPGTFVILDALPLLPNGKVDRWALPAPGELAPEEAHTAPQNLIEEVTAEILAAVLGVERVGVHDDFFALGGHSLLATRLVSQLRAVLGVELPVRQVFETPTVAALAPVIERRRGESGHDGGAGPPIVPIPRTGPLFLSFSQERLWFLDKLQPGSAVFNMPVAVRLRGALDPSLLARGLNASVQRHESLRTTFGAAHGQPFQRIAETLEVPLPLVDLSGLSGPARGSQESELRRRIAEEAVTPFDLERGPLLRARLFRCGVGDWALLVNLHHIVADGWSLQVLIRELGLSYAAFAAGEPSPLPPLEVQYADYADWQRQRLQGEVLERHLGYWRRQLSGVLPVLDLPIDRVRPPVQTFHGASRSALLTPELATDLRALGRRHSATLFMSLFAAFNLLLQRYSGQHDLLIGIPIAGRNRAQVEDQIGFFVNSLVLRTDLSGCPTFGELLARVRQVALDAYTHQDLPFEQLLQELRPERDLSRTPLFQVFFNFQNLASSSLSLPGLTIENLTSPEDFSKFDLTLYVMEEGDGGIRLDLVYNAALFTAARSREVLAQFELLLTQVAAQPDAGIDRFSLLTPEARQILPDPTAELDASWIGPVHQHLSSWAAREPRRLAVADPEGTWSYGELEAQSNRLAHRLLAGGVGRQEVIAIYAHRSATLVWAVLGALKAGAAFVVLDPAYPAARIVETLTLAQPRAWLEMTAAGGVPEALASFVAGLPGCLRLALPPWTECADGGPLADQPVADPGVPVGPDDLAYVAFTSGSTGAPKGILGRHGPLSHFLPWQRREFGLAEEDRFSLLSGLGHDPLQRDLFTPLYLGATICIPDPAEIVLPGRLSAWMRRQGVSVAHLTPAMGQLLTESGAGTPEVLPALRYVFLVGDVLTRRDVARLRLLAPGVTCVNLYGSTETQRAVGYHVVDGAEATPAPGERRGKEVLPLGWGMQDVQLLVLSHAGQLAGIGEVGEISMRSPHLARGYLGDEAGTAERFLANPFTALAGDRLYRTGDLGRYLPDGEVAFVGRADTQVKIRGFRIELGEIQAQLGRMPGVREAMVLATEEEGAGRRLVAYVVLEPGAQPAPSAADLRGHLKAALPAYMVPSAFVLLPRMLLTPNGKVDRRALLALATAQPESDTSYRAPQTRAEVVIAGILREVLGVERVSAEDNFFDLGGNSLLLVQVQSRLQAAFEREVAVLDLFSHPTVGTLARHLAPPTGPAAVAAADGAEQLKAGKDRMRRRFKQNQETAETPPRRSP
ncbi:MAG TPA: amino acid adenylation domain-containing protein [Thermoanaerobaculia bacterium]|jgi:amino acid adenylation domain-containing protein